MKPAFLFAPGAGAPSSHPWMQRWKRNLEPIGPVTVFDYVYMREGRRRPDPLPRLIATHRNELAKMRSQIPGPAILIGKSMGGRVGCHLSLQEKVAGIVCLGYPLCGGGDPTKLRDQVLRELTAPVLFVQGTRDPLCPLDLLEQIRRQMSAPNVLHVVEGGDHSLRVPKRQEQAEGRTQQQIDESIFAAIEKFVTDALQTSISL
jgi:Predicted hydrolase of the alpha/beta-hydrolase fold